MSNCEFVTFPLVSWARCGTWLYRFLILGQVWYLIVSIPDLCRLSYFVLASNRYFSTHCVEVVDILEKENAELQKLPLPRAVFLEGVKRAQYQWIIWKTSSVINPDKPMPDNHG